jgi:hypothetical protein
MNNLDSAFTAHISIGITIAVILIAVVAKYLNNKRSQHTTGGGIPEFSHVSPEIEKFARDNGFEYQIYSGQQLLPTKGRFFARLHASKNGLSGFLHDTRIIINNIVKGVYHVLPIEMFTVTQVVHSKQTRYLTRYLVAQSVLPKSYHHIYVRHKSSALDTTLTDELRVHEFESSHFNNLFEVLSDTRDNISAFELIEPQFMEFLMQMKHRYSFEIIDTSMYFYSIHDKNILADDYGELFEVIKEAYKRMRL